LTNGTTLREAYPRGAPRRELGDPDVSIPPLPCCPRPRRVVVANVGQTTRLPPYQETQQGADAGTAGLRPRSNGSQEGPPKSPYISCPRDEPSLQCPAEAAIVARELDRFLAKQERAHDHGLHTTYSPEEATGSAARSTCFDQPWT